MSEDHITHTDMRNQYRVFSPKAAENKFFKNTYKILSPIDHMLSHKTSPTKIKKTKIKTSVFSNGNGKLDITSKRKTGPYLSFLLKI